MATIIDQLIVTLGLDPKGVTEGRKKAGEDFVKSKQDATNAAKEIEAQGKRAAQFFSNLRNQALGLFAAFTAGKGIKEFTAEVTASDAAVARIARTTDQSVESLSAWRSAATAAGGSADGITGTIQNLVSQFQHFALTGESSTIPYFRALGVQISDANGHMRNTGDVLLDLADKFQHMDPARAAEFAKGLGIDPGTLNLLLKGRVAVQAYLDEAKRLGVENKKDAAAAEARQEAWRKFTQAATESGRILLTVLTPAIVWVTKKLTELSVWMNEHPHFLEAAFAGVTVIVGAISTALAGLAVSGIFATIAAGFELITGAVLVAATALAAPLAAIAAAIALVIAGYEAIKHFDEIKSFLSKPGDGKFHQKRLEGRDGGGSPGEAPKAVPEGYTQPRLKKPASATGLGGDDVAQLQALGWTREQAVGIAANIQRESGGRTDATGDNGAAYGLAQWHKDRQDAFAKRFGHDIRASTREEQLQFIDYELRQGSDVGARRAGKALGSATTADGAAAIVSRLYERPADTAGEAQARSAIALALNARAGASLPAAGAGTSAAVNGSTNDNRRTSTSTSTTNIGSITVETAATDAAGLARDLRPAIERNAFAAQANTAII